jgi:hypothetical protein
MEKVFFVYYTCSTLLTVRKTDCRDFLKKLSLDERTPREFLLGVRQPKVKHRAVLKFYE